MSAFEPYAGSNWAIVTAVHYPDPGEDVCVASELFPVACEGSRGPNEMYCCKRVDA